MQAASVFPLVHSPVSVKYLSVPLFTGLIGWVTNWTGVVMLFHPTRFAGIRVPGMRTLQNYLPRKVLQVPLGLNLGMLGWQGIIPSRAAKMGSIAVETGLIRLGTQREFYSQLDPHAIAEHIITTSRQDIHAVVERILQQRYPRVWDNLPDRARSAVHARVDKQIPQVVHQITEALGANIDQLFDAQLMVISRMERDPSLASRIFDEIGHRELRLIIHFGFVFGVLLGLPLLAVTIAFPAWWVLPLLGAAIGYITNYLAIAVIFQPATPKKIGPITLQGLFVRRQRQAALVWADIIADRIITLHNVSTELFHGPRGDRTRKMIERVLLPAVDEAVGRAKGPVRAAIGARSYSGIARTVASQTAELGRASLQDERFDRRQADNIRRLVAERTRRMPPVEFAKMLRSAIKDDEWLLILHGAVLGIAAGLLHVVIFGA